MQVLLTASDAIQALETAFLDADRQITVSFTQFDPTTPLQTARARAIGDNWADLVGHVLARGVAVSLTISDFDCLLYPAAHRSAAQSVRHLQQVAAQSGGATLIVRTAQHDGETGLLAQTLRLPCSWWQLTQTARRLNQKGPADRSAAMTDMPGLTRLLTLGRTGQLRAQVRGLPGVRRYFHNQRLAVFDRNKLIIGSFDLDRRAIETGYPHGVTLILTGPVVAESIAHLDHFLDTVAHQSRQPPVASRLLLRTLSCRRTRTSARHGTTPVLQDIWRMHDTLIRLSRKLIYLETARLYDRRLTDRLEQMARTHPGLTMILMLHGSGVALTAMERWRSWQQKRTLRQLAKAFGKRLFIGTCATPAANGPVVLSGPAAHAGQSGVSIFDSRAGIVSSANLDRAGLRFNTEAGVYLNSPGELAELRRMVMARWLPADAPEPYFALDTAALHWAAVADTNFKAPVRQRQGLLLPYAF